MTSIRLGDFLLGEPLGRGGMGVVYRATHLPTSLLVAIKGITAHAARRDDVRASLQTEVRAVAGLDHPAIVSVLDHGIVDPAAALASDGDLGRGSPWLAMELASGGTLRPFARGQRPPLRWSELRALLLRLLDALAHAHARGVLHLDLKPANILFAGDEDARPGLKLVDFGLARRIDPDPREIAETDREDAAGTPLFMAPEQFEGRGRDFGPWTDLYALGGVAWALATGRPAVAGEDIFSIAFAHLRGERVEFAPRMAVPRDFGDWLADLMAQQAELRFRCAADAAHALTLLDAPEEDVADPGYAPVEIGDGATTLASLFESSLTLPPISSAYVPTSGRHTAPPIPADWRIAERPPPLPQLVGAGLGLWGLREQPVVDRTPQRDALWAALRQVHAQGQPRTVILEGSAGSGKSRLARWLSRRAQEVGAALTLRATHSPTSSVDDGLAPMLLRALGCVGVPSEDLFARLRHRLPSSAPLPAIAEIVGPGQPPRWVFESPEERWSAIASVLAALTQDRPAVLWLDDLQWGLDAARFADWLARRDLGVLVVATVRTDLADPEAEVAVGRLRDRDSTEVVHVGPLADEDGFALVRDLLDLETVLARQVADRTAGNPLFAVQLIGDWVSRGELEATPRGFRLRAGASPELPSSLGSVWTRRIEQLLEGRSDGEVHAFELAATLGQTVDTAEWHELCARCGADPSEALMSALVEDGLAVPTSPSTDGSWVFVHGLLREAIEERAGDRRASNHLACAAMLKQRGAPPARLGLHLLEGEAYLDAADALLRAGIDAGESADFPQARAHLNAWLRAHELAELPDVDPRWTLGLVRLARVERAAGFLERSVHWGERALAGAQARGNKQDAALVEAELARAAMNRGEYEESQRLLEGALPVLEAAGLEVDSATIVRSLGMLDVYRARWESALQHLEAARLRFEAVGERTKAALCQVSMAQIERQRGDFDAAREHLEAARRSFEELDYRMGRGEAAIGLGELERATGNLAAAERWYREARTLYAEVGSIDEPVAGANLGLIRSARGDWKGAREALETARRTFALEKRRDLEAACCIALLAPAAASRDWAAFDRLMAQGLVLLERTGWVYSDIAREAERAGDQASKRGEVARSRRAWDLALKQWEGLGRSEDADRVRSRF